MGNQVITEYSGKTVSVATYGNQLDMFLAMRHAEQTGKPLRFVVKPAQDETDEGFQTVCDYSHIFDQDVENQGIATIKADGLVVPQDTSVVIESKDFPIVVLTATERKRAVVLHAGRSALTTMTACGSCNYNIISAGLRAVRGNDTNLNVNAYITASISQKCFLHDVEKDREKLQHFFDHHPEAISEQGGLDLVQVIRRELVVGGVDLSHIAHDGLCTRCHPQLASYRNRDDSNNLVVVSLKTE